MNRGSAAARVAAIVLLLALAPAMAQAYIDPGNGAYMVQLLFTLAGAALFYIRHPIRALRALKGWLFASRKSGQADPEASQPGTAPQLASAVDERPTDVDRLAR